MQCMNRRFKLALHIKTVRKNCSGLGTACRVQYAMHSIADWPSKASG